MRQASGPNSPLSYLELGGEGDRVLAVGLHLGVALLLKNRSVSTWRADVEKVAWHNLKQGCSALVLTGL